ncbi:MAG: uracil phosphoribosyltransferase [Ignavibacteria bacterium]|jgi:uracil phosphoribosyltransferase|nr:uracil phosphoribosyltransferase [Ignavibacteria bacterium]MDH7528477.1 uracil phosphoribosyltransferase [Ignavibacteria bacterium]
MKLKNLTIVDHPLAKRDLTILRDKNTTPLEFRNAIKRISSVLVTAVTKNFELKEIKVQTPLEKTVGYKLNHEVVIVPILRAGLTLVDPFLEMIPDASVGHIGLYRDEETLKPVDYYLKLPKNIRRAKVLIIDPMLATGGSASAAISFLKERGAKDITLVCLVAAPEGVNKVSTEHKDVKIFAVSLDRTLNDRGYILPGLGDAGDRTFGTF